MTSRKAKLIQKEGVCLGLQFKFLDMELICREHSVRRYQYYSMVNCCSELIKTIWEIGIL